MSTYSINLSDQDYAGFKKNPDRGYLQNRKASMRRVQRDSYAVSSQQSGLLLKYRIIEICFNILIFKFWSKDSREYAYDFPT